jgi:monooxygenase
MPDRIEHQQDRHFDVIIVGAGLSGIGAAYYLQTRCPAKSFTLLEAREEIGGTWDLFRYPGVRSDSDMYTLGYSFRPWRHEKALTDGPSILGYVRDTAVEHGIAPKIRFGHRVTRAVWSSPNALWSVEAEVGPANERIRYTCNFLYICSGYYDYAEGYMPGWPGMERFKGVIIHPQQWPNNLDYQGREVVIIGSGATAVTLAPAMAEKAAHVTLLQRSPTYVVSLPSQDAIANWLHRHLPAKLAHGLARWKNVLLSMFFYNLARLSPEHTKRRILQAAQQELGPDYDVRRHFTPTYKPWDQRLCLIPDADLFQAIRSGRVSIVTDEIETFTQAGLRLRSGDNLKASWTLKCELTSAFVCRLLNYMDANGYAWCVPRRRDGLAAEPAIPLTSGYIQRASAILPKQGSCRPWRLYQNYALDMAALRFGPVADGTLEFGSPRPDNRAA